MQNISMDSEAEFRGKWWLSDLPRHKRSGTLKYSPEHGLSLELDGVLLDFDQLYKRGHCALLGVSLRGDMISLHRCLVRESSGVTSSRFEPEIAFVGAHFTDSRTAKFDELDVQFQHLTVWAGIAGVGLRLLDNKGVKLEYSPEEQIPLYSSAEYTISIVPKSFPSVTLNGASIKLEPILRLHFRQPRTLDECRDLSHTVHDFLTLAMGSAPYPISVTLRNRRASARHLSRRRPDVHVLYEPISRFVAGDIMPNKMLFTLLDLGDRADTCIQNWITKQELLRSTYNLFNADLYSPGPYIENRLLNLFQAIETYHRRARGGKYLADDTFLSGLYAQLVASIPKDVGSDFRQSLAKGKLRYANEYSLRKRLTELLREHRPNLPDGFLKKDEKTNEFVERAVDTRNYLTHNDEASKGEAVDGVGLAVLEHQLRLLLQICLLAEIGLEPSKIKEMAQKSRTFRTIMALLPQLE